MNWDIEIDSNEEWSDEEIQEFINEHQTMTNELTPTERMHEITAKLYAFTWLFAIATAIMIGSRYTSTLFDPYATWLPIIVLGGGTLYFIWGVLTMDYEP